MRRGKPNFVVREVTASTRRTGDFGTSAGYLQACLKKGLRPRAVHDPSAIRTLGSTGSPLSVEGFRWIADAVGPSIQIVSTSGGTGLCAAFLGGGPERAGVAWRAVLPGGAGPLHGAGGEDLTSGFASWGYRVASGRKVCVTYLSGG
jgi:acyl-coenzyme A synthetase/AMP-(fatty) acid ligase